MEVFSLLKYWRTNGGATTDANLRTNATPTSTNTTTIRHVAEENDEDDTQDDDDGPFFDLEFTVPPEVECDVSESEVEDDEDDDDDDGESLPDPEGEFDFTVDSSMSTGNLTDPNLSLSPSDDLFFNGRFVPLEPSELSFSPNDSHSKLQFPGALLKPATKLRVLMLGFKKPKTTEKLEIRPESKHQQQTQQGKSSFTVKLKVEEVPIVSLFTRDNSSRNNKIKQSSEEATTTAAAIGVGSEDKKFSKDVLQKYLKMVKPLYFRVSRKNGEKSFSSPSPSPSLAAASGGGLGKFSGHLSLSPISSPTKKIDSESKQSEVNSCVKIQKEGNLTAGLRNVRKHLGKSRSASSAVAAAPSSMAAQSRRHDDSLLQQQDGIQSAILHCKRSFTASRDSDSSSSSSTSSGLSRCTSDPCQENLCREK